MPSCPNCNDSGSSDYGYWCDCPKGAEKSAAFAAELAAAKVRAADAEVKLGRVSGMPADAHPEAPRLFAGRNCWHRLMGPPQDYPCCGGQGWWKAAGLYCSENCRASVERRRVED